MLLFKYVFYSCDILFSDGPENNASGITVLRDKNRMSS